MSPVLYQALLEGELGGDVPMLESHLALREVADVVLALDLIHEVDMDVDLQDGRLKFVRGDRATNPAVERLVVRVFDVGGEAIATRKPLTFRMYLITPLWLIMDEAAL
jgi:hypothetical protein